MADTTAEKAECCPKTRVALLPKDEYKGKGTFETTKNERNGKDLRYYKVGPADSKKAVVVINDILGLDTGRHVGFADSVAEMLECTVVMPDLFRGDVATHDMMGTPQFMELVKRHSPEDIAKDMDCVYSDVLKEATSVGLVGFCWGSWVAMNESARDPQEGNIKALACFHPAWQLQGAFGGSEESIIEGAKHFALVGHCKDDTDTSKGPLVKDAPERFKLHHFEKQNHGFMTQGDVSKDEVKEDVEKGLELLKEVFAAKM